MTQTHFYSDDALTAAGPQPTNTQPGYTPTERMQSRTIREYKYTAANGTVSYNLCHVLDATDDSLPITHYNRDSKQYRQYTRECSYCYLGITHSTAAHDQRKG